MPSQSVLEIKQQQVADIKAKVEAFLFELEKYSPYYIGRYLPEMTLAEFASRIDV